jgi:hypothetical protein
MGGCAFVALKELFWPRSPKAREDDPMPQGQGGRGGNASVGGHGTALGGKGGGAGLSGRGGDGGDAQVRGDGIALGGEGGEAGQADRGGRGGRSPLEVLGIPNRQLPDGSWLWDYGKGGDGASPETPKKAD